jgi:aryl-alcohol dehydrogenase-like predicted oxidoreductase
MTRERIEALPDDDWRRRGANFQEPALSRHLETVERLRAVAEARGVSIGAVAVAWVLRNEAVDGAIAGFRSPGQVDPVVAGGELELTADEAAEIEGRE